MYVYINYRWKLFFNTHQSVSAFDTTKDLYRWLYLSCYRITYSGFRNLLKSYLVRRTSNIQLLAISFMFFTWLPILLYYLFYRMVIICLSISHSMYLEFSCTDIDLGWQSRMETTWLCLPGNQRHCNPFSQCPCIHLQVKVFPHWSPSKSLKRWLHPQMHRHQCKAIRNMKK